MRSGIIFLIYSMCSIDTFLLGNGGVSRHIDYLFDFFLAFGGRKTPAVVFDADSAWACTIFMGADESSSFHVMMLSDRAADKVKMLYWLGR